MPCPLSAAAALPRPCGPDPCPPTPPLLRQGNKVGGKFTGVPRAGDRVSNLRDMTEKLLSAGLSVVGCSGLVFRV